MKRARGIAQACGERVSHIPAIRPNEPVKVTLHSDGGANTLRFYFTDHHDACLELSEIQAERAGERRFRRPEPC